MAGIEKVCEFSGDYPGYLMYNYKKNQLQICPQYRKLFKGKEAVLHIFKPEKVWEGKGKFKFRQSHDLHMMDWYDPPFTNVKEFEKYYAWESKSRLISEYEFALQVFDENLFGEVQGIYMNWTNHVSTMKRKIKRLLKTKGIVIQKHDCSYWEWKSSLSTTNKQQKLPIIHSQKMM